MKKKIALSLSILFIFIVTIGLSVAFFNYLKEGSTENTILVNGMRFIYKEVDGNGSGINLIDALPTSDSIGKRLNEYFDFRIEADIKQETITYNVIINTTRSTLPDSYIKVYLTELSGNSETEIYNDIKKLSEYEETDKGRIIYRETLDKNVVTDYTKNFRLRLWLSDDIVYHGDVEGTTSIYTVDVNTLGGVGPSAPVIAGGNEDNEWVTESPTINLATRSTAFSGIDHYEVLDLTTDILPSESTETIITTQDEYQVTTGGKHYIYYRAVAKDGLKSSWSNKEIINIDDIGPSIPTSGSIGNVTGSNVTGTIKTVASGSTDTGIGGITYKYLVTNTDTVPDKNSPDFTTDLTFTRSCGTSYYGWAVAEDAYGNRSDVYSLGLTSDGANSYSNWNTCSKTCGTGTQTRTNACALVTTDLSQNCNTQACCSSTTYSDTNGAWGGCSKTCGTGEQYYTVTRNYYSAYDGSYCSSTPGVVTASQNCNTQACVTTVTLANNLTYSVSQTGMSTWSWSITLTGVPNAYRNSIKLLMQNEYNNRDGVYSNGNLTWNFDTSSNRNPTGCYIVYTPTNQRWDLQSNNNKPITITVTN